MCRTKIGESSAQRRSWRALSNAAMVFTTGPFQNAGIGLSLHLDAGAYRIASSQLFPLFRQQFGSGWDFSVAARPRCSATMCLGSQNCCARASGIRASALPLGDFQSVERMGSHTTSTRIFRSGYRAINCSAAEAPRRHVGQVGESSNTSRGALVSPSKADSNS